MDQAYFLKTMKKFPEEFRELILNNNLVHYCIQSGINQKLEYNKILEKTILVLAEHINVLEDSLILNEVVSTKVRGVVVNGL